MNELQDQSYYERLISEYVSGTINDHEQEILNEYLLIETELKAELEFEMTMLSQFDKKSFSNSMDIAARNVSVNVLRSLTAPADSKSRRRKYSTFAWLGMAAGVTAFLWFGSAWFSDQPSVTYPSLNVATNVAVAESSQVSGQSTAKPATIQRTNKVAAKQPDKRKHVKSEIAEFTELDYLASTSLGYQSELLSDDDVTYLLTGEAYELDY